MVDPPAVTAVLTALWGPGYVCNGLGGDFSLPGAIGKQALHSDIGPAFKYQVLDTPQARALRPRHYGANNSNLQHGRGRLFARAVAYDAPEEPGVEYLAKHDTCLDREGPCGYLNVDYTTTAWTTDNGPTQVPRGHRLASTLGSLPRRAPARAPDAPWTHFLIISFPPLPSFVCFRLRSRPSLLDRHALPRPRRSV